MQTKDDASCDCGECKYLKMKERASAKGKVAIFREHPYLEISQALVRWMADGYV